MSAGDHAIAAVSVVRDLGISAKVVMLAKTSPARVERARRYGAELVMVANVAEAFAIADRIAAE